MKRTALNLNSRYNIFCSKYPYYYGLSLGLRIPIVDSSLHTQFDSNNWLLLPEQSILDKFEQSVEDFGGTFIAKRECFPDFPVCHHIILLLSFFLTGKFLGENLFL